MKAADAAEVGAAADDAAPRNDTLYGVVTALAMSLKPDSSAATRELMPLTKALTRALASLSVDCSVAARVAKMFVSPIADSIQVNKDAVSPRADLINIIRDAKELISPKS